MDDLFKNKYFLLIVSLLIIIVAVAYFINYNSTQSKCRRHVQGLGAMLGSGDNKLQDMALKSASQPLIEQCIKRGGP